MLHDQGTKFFVSFEEFCTKTLIDHRTTSHNHPEADGLDERIVQTVRRGLCEHGLFRGNHHDWDLMILWIAMCY